MSLTRLELFNKERGCSSLRVIFQLFGEEGARVRCQEVRRDDTDIVPALRKAIAARLGERRFSAWFGSGTRLSLENDTLRIEGSNRFVVDWLQKNFQRNLEEVVREVVAPAVSIEFSVLSPVECHEATMRATKASSRRTSGDGSTVTSKKASEGERGTPEEGSPAHRDRMTFGSFVVGPSNRLARVSAELVVDSPGHFSPLVICGPTSCGKTHPLLRAVAHAARRKKQSVVSCTAEQFTTAYVQAIHGNGLPSFRNQYRAVDYLILDDFAVPSRKTRNGRGVSLYRGRPPSRRKASRTGYGSTSGEAS